MLVVTVCFLSSVLPVSPLISWVFNPFGSALLCKFQNKKRKPVTIMGTGSSSHSQRLQASHYIYDMLCCTLIKTTRVASFRTEREFIWKSSYLNNLLHTHYCRICSSSWDILDPKTLLVYIVFHYRSFNAKLIFIHHITAILMTHHNHSCVNCTSSLLIYVVVLYIN